jgi:hypothetical protein
MQTVKLERNAPHQTYHLSDGTKAPGGSTICKIGDDASALLHWAWKLGTEGKDYRKERDKAADIGTIAHFLIECFLNNQVADLSDYGQEDIDKALLCYNKFVDWWDEQRLRKVYTEIQLVHEEVRYGGTIDMIAERDNGEFVLIDFKTSKKISDSYWRQCAGYAQLFNFNNPQMVSKPYNEIKSHAIVRIGKEEEGDFEVIWRDDLSKEWFVFQKQVELYWAMQAAKPEPKPRGRKKK